MRTGILVVGLLTGLCASAEIITFNLANDPAVYLNLDDQISGSVTNGSLIVTITASEGVMNRTTSGFGINGEGTDDTDGFNAGQYIDLVFNQNVTFTNLVVSSWGGSDAAEVLLGPALISQGAVLGTDPTPYGFTVDAGTGESVRILATADSGATNGFSVDAFSIVAVPEPGVIGMVALGSGVLLLIRKRKH